MGIYKDNAHRLCIPGVSSYDNVAVVVVSTLSPIGQRGVSRFSDTIVSQSNAELPLPHILAIPLGSSHLSGLRPFAQLLSPMQLQMMRR